ncbi:Omp28-related outer membrane protein [Flavobacteriaceae bacterium]|nr:Omp28-related outer membrane protein [Flavobacteriaceae bacterium]
MKLLITRLAFFLSIISLVACSDNSLDDGSPDQNEITNLNLEFEKAFIFENESVRALVKDDRGISYNNKASFELNGELLSSSIIPFKEAGSYVLKISFEGFSKTFDVQVYENTFTTKVLVEDYTGAWCGYCPRIAYKLESIVQNNENVVPSAIHNGDPMEFQFEAQMRQRYNVTGFPTALFNRIHNWDESNGQIMNALVEQKGLGIAMESSLGASLGLMNLSVSVAENVPYENLKLVVYLQRNGRAAAQVNYYNEDQTSPAYGMGNPINEFIHDHVLLKAFTDVFGDEIPANDLSIGQNYSRSFEINMSAYGLYEENSDEFELVAFVINEDDEVINVQKVAVFESVDFQ